MESNRIVKSILSRKKVVYALFAASLLSFALHWLGYAYFHKTAPTVPDPASGKTCAITYRGDASYVTKAAYAAWWWMGLPSFFVFCIACYLDQKWVVTQSARNRHAQRFCRNK